MLELNISWLDNRHGIVIAYGKDGVEHWEMLTFFQDCDASDRTIDLKKNEDGKLFEITEIDPDDFWFNGKHYKLRKT